MYESVPKQSFLIENLDFSTRAFQFLKTNNITSLEEITHYSEQALRDLPGFSEKTFQEIGDILSQKNLSLKSN